MMGDVPANALHTLIQSERRHRGWSINQMAKECDLPPSTLYTILKRPNYVPRVETLRKLSKGLDVPLSKLAVTAGLSETEMVSGLTQEAVDRISKGSEADLLLLITAWSQLDEDGHAQLLTLARRLLDNALGEGL
jgi:transcriptional regulator with XRE-family HTH domain